jgi:hypothetical protein
VVECNCVFPVQLDQKKRKREVDPGHGTIELGAFPDDDPLFCVTPARDILYACPTASITIKTHFLVVFQDQHPFRDDEDDYH